MSTNPHRKQTYKETNILQCLNQTQLYLNKSTLKQTTFCKQTLFIQPHTHTHRTHITLIILLFGIAILFSISPSISVPLF